MQEQDDMRTADKGGETTRQPEKTFREMLNAIRDCSSDLGSSDAEPDVENEEDDAQGTKLGKLSDEEHGWVMGTMSKTVQHRMESFRQKQMRLDALTQMGWGDVANCFCQRDMGL